MGGRNCKGLLPRSTNIPSGKSGKPSKYDYIEDVVCKETDIKDNEMKLLPLGDDGGKILLIKQKGELHAVGSKCTHYGALLHTGALGDGVVRCPWHGACFDIKTGDIEDYPGLDSLPCYQVRVDDGGFIRVKAKRTELELNRRIKKMCEKDNNNTTNVVIIGGGPAAAVCAESLRQESFTGNITMVCKEGNVPYDRVKVSKDFTLDIAKVSLRPKSFYADNKIDIKLETEAIGLKTDDKLVQLSNNEKLIYDYLFICTGSKPRIPDKIPGFELSNIYTLRNYTDSHAIHSVLKSDKNVIVFGLGFIGVEAAAYCNGKCASVTVVGKGKVPLETVFGLEIGNAIKNEFESKGVAFRVEQSISKFEAREDDKTAVGQIVLENGEILPADIVIVGIGTNFCTEWIEDSPIKMLENGSIVVDKHLRTNVENVYAGGDLAYAPMFGSNNISAAIGHYSLSHYHGKIAALNICGKTTPLNSIPFFWTTLFGKSYRYAGYGKADKVKILGSPEKQEFFAYFMKNGQVISMASCGADPIVSDFANYLREGKRLMEEEIERDPYSWIRNKPNNLQERFPDESTAK